MKVLSFNIAILSPVEYVALSCRNLWRKSRVVRSQGASHPTNTGSTANKTLWQTQSASSGSRWSS